MNSKKIFPTIFLSLLIPSNNSILLRLRYVSVLVDVTRMEGTQRGPLIADQMMDVALRVKAIRGFCVQQMSLLLENAHVIAGSGCSSSNMSQVLYAAAWICGEFAT